MDCDRLPFSGPDLPQRPCFAEAACHSAGFQLWILAWEGHLLHLTFSAAAHRQAKRFLRRRFPGTLISPSPRLEAEVSERFQLFATGAAEFSFPSHPFFLESATPFRQRVWNLLARIPYGGIRTYGALAAELGGRGYARAVGGACHANPLALVIPCHRVVAAQGPGGFNGGKGVKEKLLALEKKTFQDPSFGTSNA